MAPFDAVSRLRVHGRTSLGRGEANPMNRRSRGWTAGLAVVVGVFGPEQLAAAEIGDPIEIQIAIIDRVGVPPSELSSAHLEVERIYRS